MPNFLNLRDIVRQFHTDPVTQNDPVKRMSALSIYAPHFDRTKNNIVWEKSE